MNPHRRRLLKLLGASIGQLYCSRLTAAETWPSRPIKAIVPLVAGTGADILARLIFEELSAQIGQSIIVENRPGAGGTLGAAAVANATPDGYTLLVDSSSYTIAPSMYVNLPYDPVHDFIPVIPLGSSPFLLNVAASKGWKNVGELVAAARQGQNKLTFGSAGVGSTNHLAAERFRAAAGFDAIHVPVRGGAFVPDLVAGRIDFAFGPLAPSIELIRSGHLRALAVASQNRTPLLPDVPTTIEAGYGNSDFNFYIGTFVSAKTSPVIVDRLYREIARALAVPRVREKMAKIGAEPMPMAVSEFADLINKDLEVNAALINAIGLRSK